MGKKNRPNGKSWSKAPERFSEANQTFKRAVAGASEKEPEELQSVAFSQTAALSTVPALLVQRIVHDLNNLVTGILGLCELGLSKTKGGDSESVALECAGVERGGGDEGGFGFGEEFEEIEWAAQQAAVLLQHLQGLCGDPEAQREQIYPKDAVLATLALLRRMLGDEVRLESEILEDSCPVFMKPGQLEQVLLNLVLNARDASPAGGRVKVTLESLPREFVSSIPVKRAQGREVSSVLMIQVADEGGGVSPQNRQRIFEPYFTTKKKSGGSGLGLATVKDIVEAAGGGVSVESGQRGGAVFRVFLPVV